MAPSRRQLRAARPVLVAVPGRAPIPSRFLRFEVDEWEGQAESATGIRAGGDGEIRALTLYRLARMAWGHACREWAKANGYTVQEMRDAQRAAEDPRPESR